MLEVDESITARAVARRIRLKAASSITRDPVRRAILEEFQNQQARRREWARRSEKQSVTKLQNDLATRDHEIARLVHRVELLTASHKAMILAVGEVGGMRAWARFFEGWESSLEELRALGAIGDVDLPSTGRQRGRV